MKSAFLSNQIMRSLFWKIFLWFWLAMATVAVTISAIVFVTQQQRFRERENNRGGPPSRPENRVSRQALAGHLQAVAYVLQKDGVPALQAYLQKLDNNQLRTFCFDDKNNEVLHQKSDFEPSKLLPEAQKAAKNPQSETRFAESYLLAAQHVINEWSRAAKIRIGGDLEHAL